MLTKNGSKVKRTHGNVRNRRSYNGQRDIMLSEFTDSHINNFGEMINGI